MPDFEAKNAGNYFVGQIHEPTEEIIVNGKRLTTPSIAEWWEAQGIRFIEHAPFSTPSCSTEELVAQKMIGITLLIPKPENSATQNL